MFFSTIREKCFQHLDIENKSSIWKFENISTRVFGDLMKYSDIIWTIEEIVFLKFRHLGK